MPHQQRYISSSATCTPMSFTLNNAQEAIQAIVNAEPRRDSAGVPTKASWWSRKAENIIAMVECEVQQVNETLSFLDDATPEFTALELLLDDAVKVVKSAGQSLASVKLCDKGVQQHKSKVIDMLRCLDARISQLRGLLPPRHPETTPVFVDASQSFQFNCLLMSSHFALRSYSRQSYGTSECHCADCSPVGNHMPCGGWLESRSL